MSYFIVILFVVINAPFAEAAQCTAPALREAPSMVNGSLMIQTSSDCVLNTRVANPAAELERLVGEFTRGRHVRRLVDGPNRDSLNGVPGTSYGADLSIPGIADSRPIFFRGRLRIFSVIPQYVDIVATTERFQREVRVEGSLVEWLGLTIRFYHRAGRLHAVYYTSAKLKRPDLVPDFMFIPIAEDRAKNYAARIRNEHMSQAEEALR